MGTPKKEYTKKMRIKRAFAGWYDVVSLKTYRRFTIVLNEESGLWSLKEQFKTVEFKADEFIDAFETLKEAKRELELYIL